MDYPLFYTWNFVIFYIKFIFWVTILFNTSKVETIFPITKLFFHSSRNLSQLTLLTWTRFPFDQTKIQSHFSAVLVWCMEDVFSLISFPFPSFRCPVWLMMVVRWHIIQEYVSLITSIFIFRKLNLVCEHWFCICWLRKFNANVKKCDVLGKLNFKFFMLWTLWLTRVTS